ncbi:hypothetical protein [Derxia gummosa]|uniref:Uncharacterized protein n=1 Tax=Derxia gummosa DSM 723 TaxID=1121388 RepID=A0A8B6X7R1_9BURK|nr:hypothetical protein [Derxia gummosa]
MSTPGLDQPLAASGEARTYFFNGRLLSAEDLQREQIAREAGQRRLARLAGCGIERGLGVTLAGARLIGIGAGLGVTPSGAIIETTGFELDLAGSGAGGTAAGRFGDCAARFGSLGALAGTHLLVLTPAWIGEGRAPTLLGEVGACNRRQELPGLRARLVPLNPPADATAATLRNRLATALFGTAGLAADRVVGWWPATVAPTLRADDLPIAVLAINTAGNLDWVDTDAARRRLAPPPGAEGDALWPRSERVAMEAFARQCARQLAEGAALPAARAAEGTAAAFPVLPPLLLLDAAGLDRWRAVFGALPALAAEWEIELGREDFARALDGGLDARPVAQARATAMLYRLWRAPGDGGADQWLLRLRDGAEPGASPEYRQIDGDRALVTSSERTSARVASLAGQVLNDPRSTATERSLAASALTQAPDKVKRAARKTTPAKRGAGG